MLRGLDLTLQYAFGFDFARVADLTAGVLLAIEGALKRREALTFELRNVPGDEQKLITGLVLDHVKSRLVGAAFDATGMGWTVAEDMGRRFSFKEDPEGPGLVMAVKFTEDWYRIHMPPLKAAFEDDGITVIADVEHLGDLRAVKLVRGTARVPATREGETNKKRHGDWAICLALAHYASRLRWSEFDYQPAPRPQDAAPDRMADRAEDDSSKDRGWWSGPLGSVLKGWL